MDPLRRARMASDLSPNEKEDREAERLMGRKRAPSRKHKEKRAPRRDMKRVRTKVDDPDIKAPSEANKDMSLRSRSAALSAMALRVAFFGKKKYELDEDDEPGEKHLRDLSDKDLGRIDNSIGDFFGGDPLDDDRIGDLLDSLDYSDSNLKALKGEMEAYLLPDKSGPPTDDSHESDSEQSEEVSDDDKRQPGPLLQALIKRMGEEDSSKAKELEEDFKNPNKPGPLLKALMKRMGIAASNGIYGWMSNRTGAYHGVLDQRGNPTDPANTGYGSHDRRHFTDKHYDRIVKYASKLLGEPWLKYGWDGGAEDAPVRAALDLAIHLADGSLYQSKIDPETYNLLLNRLAKWGHDTFSETVLPMKTKGKRTSAMKDSAAYKNIIRIASQVRNEDPKLAFEIVRNIRSLVATDAVAPTISEHVSQDGPPPGLELPPPGAAEADTAGSGLDPQGLDDFVELGENPEYKQFLDQMKSGMKKLKLDDKDVDDFMKGFEDNFLKKTAGAFVPLSLLVKVASASPQAKMLLASVIIAAAKRKKDKDKAKDKKKDKKDDKAAASKKDDKSDKKAPPFGGKGAPPFGKGKGKSKSKKRKASITDEDAGW